MKRLCLGMLIGSEEMFIHKIFPFLAVAFDGVVVLDSGMGPRTRGFVMTVGSDIIPFQWINNFEVARNTLIEKAAGLGYDYMMMLDADETIHREDVKMIKDALQHYDIIRFPRINFIRDEYHYSPDVYPDYQNRAIKLDRGIRYEGKVHETITALPSFSSVILPSIHIYHYGWCKPTRAVYLKNVNYDRLTRGEEPLKALAEDCKVEEIQHSSVMYFGQQP